MSLSLEVYEEAGRCEIGPNEELWQAGSHEGQQIV